MRKLVLSTIGVLVTVTIFAQVNTQKSFDIGGDDFGNQIQFAPGGTVVGGSTSKAGAGDYDAFIMGFDTAGNALWEKQYGSTGTEYGTSITVKHTGVAPT